MTKKSSKKTATKKRTVKSTIKKAAHTVSDAMSHKAEPKLMDCEFCGHRFDAACGKYGCPNCHGEGLKPAARGNCIALMAINPLLSRPAVRTFTIIPTFGSAGAEHDLKLVLQDSKWQGYRLMTHDGTTWLEPYKP